MRDRAQSIMLIQTNCLPFVLLHSTKLLVNEVNMGEEEEESIDRICKDMVILGKISKVKITKTEGKNLPNYCFDRAT